MIHCVVLRSVALRLRSVAIHCVLSAVLRYFVCDPSCCVAIRCVVSGVLRCVALRSILLCCDPLRCVTFAFCWNSLCCICCVALRCVVIRCVVLFTSSAFLVFRLC